MASIIQATADHAEEIFMLRLDEYSKAPEFNLLDEDTLRWDDHDEQGLVLIALNKESEVVSTMTGLIVHNSQEAHQTLGLSDDSLAETDFPALVLKRAATRSNYQTNGLNGAMRYHFLHYAIDNGVHNLLGIVYKTSPRVHTMVELGYEFSDVSHEDELTIWHSIQPLLLARLSRNKMASALKILEETMAEAITAFPFHSAPNTHQ